MEHKRAGALPSQKLRALIDAGHIVDATDANISPASLDLTLSSELFEINGLLLPKRGETIRSLLEPMGAKAVSITEPLQCHNLYLARLNETLTLPSQVYGFCNPKSSTGRLDVHVRVMADGVPRYDSITPKGYKGELWVAIFPKSFSVLVHEGIPLTQLRLFTGDTRFSELDLEIAIKQHGLIWHEKEEWPLMYEELITHDQDGAMVLSALVESGTCGYECIAKPEQVLDVANVQGYAAEDFFVPIESDQGFLHLKRNKFYILSCAERVRIPPLLAAEMIPMDERSGDFRSHYAGFLDPGWGWGVDGTGHGRPFTLEVRPFEDLLVRKEQPIAKIRFEQMIDEPDIHYDTKDSNYLNQTGAKLAKQFK